MTLFVEEEEEELIVPVAVAAVPVECVRKDRVALVHRDLAVGIVRRDAGLDCMDGVPIVHRGVFHTALPLVRLDMVRRHVAGLVRKGCVHPAAREAPLVVGRVLGIERRGSHSRASGVGCTALESPKQP